jgi:hypothetical protein
MPSPQSSICPTTNKHTIILYTRQSSSPSRSLFCVCVCVSPGLPIFFRFGSRQVRQS